MNILVIEDNESVSEVAQMFFLNEEWEATFKDGGKEGLVTFLASPGRWNMITLDLNLPSTDGIAVCREIHKVSASVPTIMLAARDSESDQVVGPEMGANDHVTKPLSPLTLIVRIKALHRRAGMAEAAHDTSESTDETFGVITDHFKVNTKTRETYLDNQLIEGLAPKEFDLLYTLAKRSRQIFSHEQLLGLVWDYRYSGDERTVDAHIKKLRQEIEEVDPQVIQAVWGVGYRFDDSDVA